MFYTYAHYKAGTGTIFYIGKGKGNRHSSKYGRKNPFWKAIVNKYGFTSEILAEWKTEEEAFEHEKLLINCFKDMGVKLCNLTDGGEGCAGLVFTDIHKNRLKTSRIGKTPMLGKKHSEETRMKMSKAAKLREENKRNVSNRLA